MASRICLLSCVHDRSFSFGFGAGKGLCYTAQQLQTFMSLLTSAFRNLASCFTELRFCHTYTSTGGQSLQSRPSVPLTASGSKVNPVLTNM